jgi:thioesterase domain-containing protein
MAAIQSSMLANDVGTIGPAASVGEMAESYLRTVAQSEVGTPLVLGGWSLGGLIAYEMAARLNDRGMSVRSVVLIDSIWRLSRKAGLRAERRQAAFQFLKSICGAEAEPAKRLAASIGIADDLLTANTSKALSQVVQRCREIGLFAGISDGNAGRMIALFRSNLATIRRYRPSSYDGPVLAFGASRTESPSNWADCARAVETVLVDGDHYSIMEQPSIRAIGEEILSRIYTR